MDNNEWLTPKDVAEYLKVSLTTVYRWTGLGVLRKHKIGRFNRYKKSEVDAAVKNGQAGEGE